MTPFILLALAVVLVAVGGLMAALDAALSVTSRSALIEWSHEGRRGEALRRIADDLPTHANAVVFMRILTETAAAVLVTAAFMLLFDNIWWAMLAAAVLMTLISFVLVSTSPRSVGRQHATGLLRSAAGVVRLSRIIIGPLSHALVAFGDRVTPGVTRGASFTSEDQLLSMVDEAASHDLIEEDDRELIHSVFDFTDRFVRALMIPRTDLVTLEDGATAREAMDLFLETGVSRVPVVDGDEVLGVLYVKDLVRAAYGQDGADVWDASARPLARRAVFVPESMKAETLLQQMKRDAIHVCIVVDEYGGVAGLVTLEDLIEDLVGDISDEYDKEWSEVTDLGDGRYRVSGRSLLEEVGELFDLEIEDDEVDSIGGLLAKELGRIPESGASATVQGVTITAEHGRGGPRDLATFIVERAEEPATEAEPRTRDTPVIRKAE
ncbi:MULTISPECIES: hemolysin family protein [Microbacterium]|uniref:hemolysin family protein n=1 Tax=Microbacterium TaxID=33882 RepID=UPI001E480373|nr:hemolysin family protein [Microbacterium nymphoidis]MCD2499262.1 hemolysin family protein [Microbacterium nymphoidis]